ncbi:MAG: ATP-grasp domain-containing protein [Patescibacteria group bacterium]|jgi:predicted ATP-grasp superfamily ATP-dependent carboligase
MKVLITDASSLHTLAILRYLSKESIDTFVIRKNKLDVSCYSKYCKGSFIAPSSEDEKTYINFILKILAQEKFDILMPVSYFATAIAAKYKNEINKISKVEIADYDKVQIALNKKSTYDLAEKIGVPYPKTFYPDSLDTIERMAPNFEYPVVIKWILEVGCNIVSIVQDKKELIKEYHKICQKYHPSNDILPMIQEFISTDNNEVYCLSALYQNGKCKRIFMQKQTRNVPPTGGTTAYAESCFIPEIKKYSLELLDKLSWHGVVNIEFKLDKKNNIFKLMEINPKFWASTEMALKAGVNFPYLLCQMAQGKELEYSEEYNRNLRFHFPFSRELQHAKGKPSSILKIIIDTLNPKVKSNIWISDIKPNLIELGMYLGLIIIPKRFKSIIKSLLRMK